jgi:transcription initiation factor IIE alpha subunit|tara:strand:- start:51 stop:281 length:231 start_codon:yes stop_codon:yes gene_type:complete
MEQNDNPSILNNVNNIENKISKLVKEKTNIQQSCSHKEVMINFDEQRSIKKYCSECKRELGYATKEEEADFLKPKG